jgi:fengycin family lipopeptide synthetase D
VLALDVHHIIMDGRSLDRSLREVSLALVGVETPIQGVQFKDYAVWQQKQLSAGKLEKDLQYWNQRLKHPAPPLELDCCKKRPPVFTYNGAKISGEIPAGLRNHVVQVAKDCGTTEFVVLLASFYILLMRHSGQRGIAVGTVVNGRIHSDVQDTLGMFVNTLALTSIVEEGELVERFIKRIHTSVYEDFEHQALPFDSLVDQLNIVRDVGRNPLFDVMFVLQEENQQELFLDDTSFSMLNFSDKTSKYDLTFELTPVADGCLCIVEYCTDLFEKDTAETMLSHYLTILESISTQVTVDDVRYISEREQEQLLSFAQNANQFTLDSLSINEVFAHSVIKYRDLPAVTDGRTELSYQQLDNKVGRLAYALKKRGIGIGDFVVIAASHSIDMIAAAFAVIRCGGAYVPVDIQTPDDRVSYIISDCGAKLVLRDQTIVENGVVAQAAAIVDLTDGEEGYLGWNGGNMSDSPAYVIYTSGSTGKPKGVMLTHANMMTYLAAYKKYVLRDERFTMLQLASFAFDVSVEEIFGTLVFGGKLVLIETKQMLDLDAFYQLIEEHNVDYMSTTPAFAGLLNARPEGMNIKSCVVGGDVVHFHCVDNLVRHMRVINSYGPTETCVGATYYYADNEKRHIPIGWPLPGYNVYVLDQNLDLCGFDIQGEICISGSAVSPGYINLPEETAERFVKDPFCGTSMYRTGDLGIVRSNGEIEFKHRIDHQVKLRGYRIECDEIVKAAASTGLVDDIAVDVFEIAGIKRLCGAYTASEEVSDILLKRLTKTLPAFMLPEVLIKIESLPMTINGKLDRDKLAETFVHVRPQRMVRMPSTENEHLLSQIWEHAIGTSDIPVDVSFWEAGGNSIAAVSMLMEARENGYKIDINDIFSNASIEDLAPQRSLIVKTIGSCDELCMLVSEKIDIACQVVSEVDGVKYLRVPQPYSCEIEEQILSTLSVYSCSDGGFSALLWTDSEQKEIPITDKLNAFVDGFNFARQDNTWSITPAQVFYITIDKQFCHDRIRIDGYFSKEQICEAVRMLIGIQPMLRAGYTKTGFASAVITCYTPQRPAFIPYIDLHTCPRHAIPDKLTELAGKVCEKKLGKKLPYRLAIVRTSLSEHVILLYIHHAFYDMFSGAVIKNQISALLAGKCLPELPCNSGGSVQQLITAEALSIRFALDEFYDLSRDFARNAERHKKGHVRFTRIYRYDTGKDERKVFDTSVGYVIDFFCKLYEMDAVPLWFLYHGRGMSEYANYDRVGAFLDVIPMIGRIGDDNSAESVLQDAIDFLKRTCTSFGKVLLGIDPVLTNTTLNKQLRKLVSEQFIAVNFQGGDSGTGDDTLVAHQEINLKKHMAIITYNEEQIKIIFDIPVDFQQQPE